jgi:hypothetical protein
MNVNIIAVLDQIYGSGWKKGASTLRLIEVNVAWEKMANDETEGETYSLQ